jgi:hypothetical protein
MELLRQLDDPAWLECPRGYSSDDVAASFGHLLSRLEADFGAQCTAEREIQDSSQYGRIEIPAEVTACGTRIIVSVSKFGSLAVVSAENPGAFLGTTDAREEGELDDGDLNKAERVLSDLEYVLVPEELLTRRYDGVSRLALQGVGGRWQPSWWDRFFGSF